MLFRSDSVPLVFPEGMVFDTVHNFMYISDSYRVRRIDLQTNLMRTIAGDGTANFADRQYNVDALQTPVFTFGRLAIDHAGNVSAWGPTNTTSASEANIDSIPPPVPTVTPTAACPAGTNTVTGFSANGTDGSPICQSSCVFTRSWQLHLLERSGRRLQTAGI